MSVVPGCRSGTVDTTGYRRVNAALAGILALLAQASGAAAAKPEEAGARYDRCLAEARSDPDAAYAEATAWQQLGGGLPARHCAAVALVGQRAFPEAAARLEALAEEAPAEDPVLRRGLLAQAAQAWLLAGQAARAEEIQGRAIELAPDDRRLRIGRAVARLTLGKPWEAVDDLNVAIDLDPRDPEALLYRASAYRYLDAVELAIDDVRRAIEIDPGRPEAWLERGILEQLAGEPDNARRSWAEVLRLQPDGPAAAAARTRIEALDAGRR